MKLSKTKVFTLFTLAASLSALAPVGAAAQGQPVALVMGVDGSTVPSVTVYAELMNRATVMLKPGTKMSFVHYGTCRLIEVSGGRLYVDALRFSLAGGRIVSEQKTDCPREQALGEGGGTAAGIVMRGVHGAPHLTSHPHVILTGRASHMFKSAELRRGDTSLGAMTVKGHMVAWPANQNALPPGKDYVLHLVAADGKRTLDFLFSVAGAGVPGEAAAILRLD